MLGAKRGFGQSILHKWMDGWMELTHTQSHSVHSTACCRLLVSLVIHGLHETMFMTVSHSVVKEAQGMTHPHLHRIRDSGRERDT